MSALPPKADMLIVGIDVCYVPQADIHRNAAGGLQSDRLKVSKTTLWARGQE